MADEISFQYMDRKTRFRTADINGRMSFQDALHKDQHDMDQKIQVFGAHVYRVKLD